MNSDQADFDRALRASVPFAIAEAWDVECVYERSIKLAHGKLLANRYMIALEAKRLTSSQLAEAFQNLKMDARAHAEIQANMGNANLILFGFEEEAESASYKVYLELKTDRQTLVGEPQLKHLGYKWQIGCEANFRIAKYLWYPSICQPKQIQERISEIWGKQETPASVFVDSILEGVVDVNKSVAFIESSEEGSPRRAFDLNLYELELSIDQFMQPIQRLSKSYELNPLELQRWQDVVRGKQLGHVSAGIDRFGQDFVTLYYL